MSDLAKRECVPCRGGVPPLAGAEITKLLSELDGWEVVNEHHLKKSYKFGDFGAALQFVNRVGDGIFIDSELPKSFPELRRSGRLRLVYRYRCLDMSLLRSWRFRIGWPCL